MRPLGEVLLDLEIILDEMIIQHDLQRGDVLALINTHITVHNPGSIEQYVDGSPSPEMYYGPDRVKLKNAVYKVLRLTSGPKADNIKIKEIIKVLGDGLR